jgi:predicted small lipoprotein YifL
MNKPVAFAAIAALSLTLLAACGNKGPLVRPSDIPPPAEAVPAATSAPAPAPATEGATLPDTTPPTQPPVTDVVAPPPAQGDGD